MSQLSSEGLSPSQSQNLSVCRPTKAYIEGQYKGPKPDGTWKPPDRIISPPSAQLCKTTKAVVAQRYDDSRRPATPHREKSWVSYTSPSTTEMQLHKDAGSLLKNSKYLAKRTGPEVATHDILKTTTSVINHQYKKPDPRKQKSAIWQAPKVIVPPSVHLLKTTTAIEKGKWTKGDPLRAATPEAKRERNWKKYASDSVRI